jgi:tRNA(His) guanylyltransferase
LVRRSVQKIVSIAASCATPAFNRSRLERPRQDSAGHARWAMFDARAFTIPDPVEVENYFIWRQQDATRNSISMAAQAYFGHETLVGVSSNGSQDMLWREKSMSWNDYPVGCKRGRVVIRQTYSTDVTPIDKRTQEGRVAPNVTRSRWTTTDPPIFTQDRAWLADRIPRY